MKHSLITVSLIASSIVILSGFDSIIRPISKNWKKDTPVNEVLEDLGMPPLPHKIIPKEEQIKEGQELVKSGRTIHNGKQTKYISKYYVCTTCHTLEREDPVLYQSNPETRLTYVKEKGLPFLQGTTFWGITNRESWYNDDYVKKYGDEKIERAHKNLRESIQLCAIECSQGRPMEDWEIESVLAYFWTLELEMKDLALSGADWTRLKTESKVPTKRLALIQWLKSKYAIKSPATFYDAPPNKKEGFKSYEGRPDVGKDLYELSCLWCHKPYGVSHYILDNSKHSFRHLKKMIPKNSHFSLYQIIAYGTYAIPGHKPYMPHYPLERMSKQQVEDLRAYIQLKAE